MPEWAAAFARDPDGLKGLLVPIKIRDCDLTGLLPQIIYIDLVGKDEEAAKAELMNKIKPGRGRAISPRFPGLASTSPKLPIFPFNLPIDSKNPISQLPDYTKLAFEQILAGTGDELFSIAFSPDGTRVAAGSHGFILLWDRKRPKRPVKLKANETYVYSVAFSHDSKLIAGGCEDCFVRVWDVAAGILVWEEKQHTEAVYSITFSPDGKRLASGSYDKRVQIWDSENGQLQRSSDRALDTIGKISSVAFSPDGTTIAVASLDDTVRLWDTRTRKADILRGHSSSVEAVSFSPDGLRLASCGLDKTVRIWDVKSRRLERTCKEHEYLVRSVAFSPDGVTLASASWDKTVKLWNVTTGELIRTLPFKTELPWHTDWIWSVAFSPEGMVLASGGSDGKIILWLVDNALKK